MKYFKCFNVKHCPYGSDDQCIKDSININTKPLVCTFQKWQEITKDEFLKEIE